MCILCKRPEKQRPFYNGRNFGTGVETMSENKILSELLIAQKELKTVQHERDHYRKALKKIKDRRRGYCSVLAENAISGYTEK